MATWRHRVTEAEAGLRLDRLVERAHPAWTRSQVKKLADAGRVRVNGSPAKAGRAAWAGEEIEIQVPPPPEVIPRPETIPLTVVYEDEDVLVVDKPAGMVVHPGAGRSHGTLVSALLGRGTRLSTMGAPLRPGIVHRLDKDTSGLLVVAKTDAAHLALSRALAAHEVERRYWALVWGVPQPAEGRIAAPLGRSRTDRRRMRVVRSGGKEAATRYVVRWSGNGVSVVVLALETGRTHQIRAHFKHRGHPVFGDPDYGGRLRRVGQLRAPERERARRALAVLSRQALHAGVLAFRHPADGRKMVFESALAEDILQAAAVLDVPPRVARLPAKEEA